MAMTSASASFTASRADEANSASATALMARAFCIPFGSYATTCAPSRSKSATSSIATDERRSSVSGLKVRPHTAIRFSRNTHSVSRIAFRKRSFWPLLMRCTSFSKLKGTPSRSAIVMKAAISLGKQEPPYPIPALRKSRPIR